MGFCSKRSGGGGGGGISFVLDVVGGGMLCCVIWSVVSDIFFNVEVKRIGKPQF